MNSAERRAAILDAAAGVFAVRGYRAATMDDVAAAVGVAKGTLYLYFDNKEALFFALFERFADGAMEEGMADLAGMNAVDAVERILIDVAERIDADTVLVPLTLEFWAAAGVGEARARFGPRYGAMLAAFRGAVIALLSEGQRRGEVAADVPLQPLASSLLALIDGLIVQRWVEDDLSVAQAMRAALPVLLAGVRGRPND